MPPLRTIINSVRVISPELPIQVYLNDLPECRFDKTIDTVTKGLKDIKNVYLIAVGKDFTTQVFPKRHIDIGFSTLSVMIQSSSPSPLLENIFFLETNALHETKEGKLWIDALQRHFNLFL